MMDNILLEVSVNSHPGKVRFNNEDMAYANGIFRNNAEHPSFSFSEEQKGPLLLYAVCDGMGGESNGEKASYEAVICLEEHQQDILQDKSMRTPELLKNRLREYITDANQRIYNLWSNSNEGRMGSTFAGLAFCGRTAFAFNLGDSRVYLMRGGAIDLGTKDHTEAERLAAMGVIARQDIVKHPRRHMLTRHFGVSSEEGMMEADFSSLVPVKKSDMFLLCSDGLTDMVSEERIQQLLAQQTDTAEIATALVQEALEKGGRDNVTVVVIRVLGVGASVMLRRAKSCN